LSAYVKYPEIPDDTDGIGVDGLLQEYYSWLLSAQPKYHGFPTEPLFCHGTISYKYDEKAEEYVVEKPVNIRGNVKGEALDLSERITTETLVVVDVLSSFFFTNDLREDGSVVRTRRDCYLGCSDDHTYERGCFATIRKIDDPPDKAKPITIFHVGPVPLNVEVDQSNPYLDKFASSPQKLAPGPKSGYASSWMCMFKIPKPGEYILEYGGEGKPPYHSQACIQIIVSPPGIRGPSDVKPRKLDVTAEFLPH
jgi:hypothetical protein